MSIFKTVALLFKDIARPFAAAAYDEDDSTPISRKLALFEEIKERGAGVVISKNAESPDMPQWSAMLYLDGYKSPPLTFAGVTEYEALYDAAMYLRKRAESAETKEYPTAEHPIEVMRRFVPMTPAGTPVFEEKAATYERCKLNLIGATAHMPYNEDFDLLYLRGYRILEVNYDEDHEISSMRTLSKSGDSYEFV